MTDSFVKNNNGLDDVLRKYNTKINRFGGYKISFNDINVDIWRIENTWAFKNQKINNKKSQKKELKKFF